MCQYGHFLFPSLAESGYEAHSLESAGEPEDISPCLVLCLLIFVSAYARASIRPVLRWETFLQVWRLIRLQRFLPVYRNRYGFPQIPLHFRSEIHVYHRQLTSWCLRSNTLFGFEMVVTMLCSPFHLLSGFIPWGTMHVIGSQCLDV